MTNSEKKRLAWCRDELILALDAYFTFGQLGKSSKEAENLSNVLRALPIHPVGDRGENFRSPSSVRYKISNFSSAHTGKGHAHGGSLEKSILMEYQNRLEELRNLANRIKEEAATSQIEDASNVPGDLDMELEVPEGRLLLRKHLSRERDPKIKKLKLDETLRLGKPIICESCGFDFEKTYGNRGRGYIECHHRLALSDSGPTRTKLMDLALLCSNCHRMIHRVRPWILPEELSFIVQHQRKSQR